MKLYDFAFSPNCRKVRAVAYELGMELEHSTVNLTKGEQRAASFLAKNPNGRVPVLEDGDLLLWESTAIMRYLAAKHGAGASSLVPAGIREQADMDRWLAWHSAHLSPAMSKVAYERIAKKLTGQGTPDPVRVAEGTAEFAALSATLDASLGRREYLTGRLSLADFALGARLQKRCACSKRVHGVAPSSRDIRNAVAASPLFAAVVEPRPRSSTRARVSPR